MYSEDLLYQLALTMVPSIGHVHAKTLLQYFEPGEIFKAKKSALEKIDNIGPSRAAAIASFNDFDEAEVEIRFLEKNDITPLFITDTSYPRRLLTCDDAPVLLFYKGTADLNNDRIISIIGTRQPGDQAPFTTEKIIAELACEQVLVVSGLAFGVDAMAHRAALKNGLPTVGVLAHGLDQLYPTAHRPLAHEMITHGGGLLTEFRQGVLPDRHNFPGRNRIVAGMSDATVVIETGLRGGSMITAELANGYHRDVFAVPGRITDPRSAGCHQLIQQHKAMLVTSGQDIIAAMGWQAKKKQASLQRSLFPALEGTDRIVFDLIATEPKIHVDDIASKTGLTGGTIASALLNLEMLGAILSLPGKIYQPA